MLDWFRQELFTFNEAYAQKKLVDIFQQHDIKIPIMKITFSYFQVRQQSRCPEISATNFSQGTESCSFFAAWLHAPATVRTLSMASSIKTLAPPFSASVAKWGKMKITTNNQPLDSLSLSRSKKRSSLFTNPCNQCNLALIFCSPPFCSTVKTTAPLQ